MLKKLNQCDVFVGLWCIYNIYVVLFPPTIINRILQLIMMLWSMTAVAKYMIQSTFYEYSPILKATLLLLIMYAVYGTIHIMFGEAIKHEQYVYLQNALNSLGPIFLFYEFTMNGKLTSDRIRIYLPILIVIYILLYYKNESQALLQNDAEEITNNIGYQFIPLISFLFFYSKKPILQYAFMGIILLYIFMSMKRGAILVGVVAAMVFLYANLKESSRWTKVLVAMLTVVIVVGISKYIDFMMSNSTYFMARVEQTLEGDSSGRDVIYGTLWNTLRLEQNPFYFLFGRGAESTVRIAGDFAHQDWLEIFCNNGLIGVFILLFFFYTLGKNVWDSRYSFSGMMFYSFATLFIIIFSKTLFSMSIQSLDLSESMLLGYFVYWATQQTEDFEYCNEEQDE